MPPPGNLPYPGIKPRSPALQTDSLSSESPGKPSRDWASGNSGGKAARGYEGYAQGSVSGSCCAGWGCGWGPVWWLTWIKGLLVEKALKIKEMGEMLLNTQRLKPPKVQGVGGNPDTGR